MTDIEQFNIGVHILAISDCMLLTNYYQLLEDDFVGLTKQHKGQIFPYLPGSTPLSINQIDINVHNYHHILPLKWNDFFSTTHFRTDKIGAVKNGDTTIGLIHMYIYGDNNIQPTNASHFVPTRNIIYYTVKFDINDWHNPLTGTDLYRIPTLESFNTLRKKSRTAANIDIFNILYSGIIGVNLISQELREQQVRTSQFSLRKLSEDDIFHLFAWLTEQLGANMAGEIYQYL